MITRLFPATLCLAFLAACGGGGGGGGGTTTPPTTAPSNLSYAIQAVFYLLGIDAGTNTPVVTGTVDSYSVTPALPAGMTLDPLTGVISGTPTTEITKTDFTIKATNAMGFANTVLTIGVTSPPRFAYVPNADDDTISIYTVDALSGQLQFNGFQRAPLGETNPEQVVVHPSGNFIYVPNLGDGVNPSNISIYAVDSTSGMLNPRPPAITGAGPHTMAIDPAGEHAYVSSEGSDQLFVYTINQVTGVLTQLGSPTMTAGGPSFIVLDPIDRYALVGNRAASSLQLFPIDPTPGPDYGQLLAPLPPIDLFSGTPVGLAVDPDGAHAYAVLSDFQIILPIDIDLMTGAMTPQMNTPSTGANPTAVSLHPTGLFAYVTNGDNDSVSVYDIDQASGSVVPSMSPIDTGDDPGFLGFDGSGQYAYTTNRGSNDVSVFSVSPITGSLAPIDRIRTRGNPRWIDIGQGLTPVTREPRFVYAANETDGSINAFDADANTGVITEIAPVLTGTLPSSIAADPSGHFLYACNAGDSTVTAYTINQGDGSLSEIMFPSWPLPVFGEPRSIAIEPSGRHAFIVSRGASGSGLSIYRINANTGLLLFVGGSGTGTDPQGIGVDPTGQFVYSCNMGSNDITAFEVHDGAIVGGPFSLPVPGGPSSIRFSPLGDRAYVTLADSNEIAGFDIDTNSGELTAIATLATGVLPTSLTLHPNGRFGWAAVNDPLAVGSVSAFTIDSATGLMTASAPTPIGLNPYAASVDPSGMFLYVTNSTGNDISLFTIDLATGNLNATGAFAAGMRPIDITTTVLLQ